MFDEEHVIYRYKYLPFSEGAKKILTEGTIKFTCPLEFNDPFDCFPHYDTKNIGNLPRMRPDLFKAAGDRLGLSPAKRLQERGKFISRLRNRIDSGEFVTNLMRDVGVVSLSKTGLNILMWSHYADFHHGFVLEFRIPIMGQKRDVSLATDRLLPFPVSYREDRPHILIGVEQPKDLMEKVLLTKSLDWKYEEEERVIDKDRGPGIRPFRRDEVLCSVIAGMKMVDKNYQELNELVSGLANRAIPSLDLFRARAKEGEYRLYVEGHPRLGDVR